MKTKYTTYGKRGMPLKAIGQMHYAQGGRCANPGCRSLIPAYGRKRAVDHDTAGKPLGMLCKPCSMALANTARSPRKIVGLLAYLGIIPESSVPGEPPAKFKNNS